MQKLCVRRLGGERGSDRSAWILVRVSWLPALRVRDSPDLWASKSGAREFSVGADGERCGWEEFEMKLRGQGPFYVLGRIRSVWGRAEEPMRRYFCHKGYEGDRDHEHENVLSFRRNHMLACFGNKPGRGSRVGLSGWNHCFGEQERSASFFGGLAVGSAATVEQDELGSVAKRGRHSSDPAPSGSPAACQLPCLLFPSRCSAKGMVRREKEGAVLSFFLKIPSMFDSLFLPPFSIPLPVSLTDVVPRLARCARCCSRVLGVCNQPRFPLWLSEGSRRELGGLARIVSCSCPLPHHIDVTDVTQCARRVGVPSVSVGLDLRLPMRRFFSFYRGSYITLVYNAEIPNSNLLMRSFCIRVPFYRGVYLFFLAPPFWSSYLPHSFRKMGDSDDTWVVLALDNPQPFR